MVWKNTLHYRDNIRRQNFWPIDRPFTNIYIPLAVSIMEVVFKVPLYRVKSLFENKDTNVYRKPWLDVVRYASKINSHYMRLLSDFLLLSPFTRHQRSCHSRVWGWTGSYHLLLALQTLSPGYPLCWARGRASKESVEDQLKYTVLDFFRWQRRRLYPSQGVW